MASEGVKLHVVMFPWLAFGHIIPFLELSKFIAKKGHRVSFLSTQRNIDRLPKLPPDLTPLINLVKLTLPHLDELPKDAEATMDVHTNAVHYLKKAFDGLEPELTHFLETESPDWVIFDFAPHWLPPIAAKLGISRAYFSIINAWFIAFLGASTSAMIEDSDSRTTLEDFTVPPPWVPFPTNVAYRHYEIRRLIGSPMDNASGVTEWHRIGCVIFGCEAIFIRHSLEFEPKWLKLLEELHHRPVIPVGLIPPSLQDSGDDHRDETWLTVKEWLDNQCKESVVYIALGSEVTLTQNELTELALGLEYSGVPFFWALRKPPGSNESDSVELPGGFVERIKCRGVVWTSWAPQLKILAHQSVGGFLTHCGWSSIIEGLTFGHPLVMLPFMVDQGLNARVLVGKKVGIEVQRDERDGSFRRDSVSESLRLVMVDNEGRRAYREKAKVMSAIFGDQDLHNRYIDNFIQYLENKRILTEV